MFNRLYKQQGGALIGVLIVLILIAAIYFGSSFFLKKDKGGLEQSLDTLNSAKEDIADIQKGLDEKNKEIKNILNDSSDKIKNILDDSDDKESAPIAELANPASAYCEKIGGKLEMRENEAGTAGYCLLNGQECEEWMLFRGECPDMAPGSIKSLENTEETDDYITQNWQELVREDQNFKIKYHKNWYYTINRNEAVQDGYEMIIGFEKDENIWEKMPPYEVELVILNENIEWKYSGYVKELGKKNGKKYVLRTGNREEYTNIIDLMAGTFQFLNEIADFSINTEQEDWQTYRNEKYGFEVKLPSTWKAYSDYDGSVIANNPSSFPNNPSIITGIVPEINFQINYKENIFIDKYIESFYKDKQTENSLVTDSGIEVKEVISDSGFNYLISSGNNTIDIYSNIFNNIIKNILLSFKLINN